METLSKNKIKLVRSLQRKKYRDELDMFIIEGAKSVREAVSEYPELVEFVCTSEEMKPIHDEHYHLSGSELNKISSLKSGTNWLVVMHKPKLSVGTQEFIVVLDGIQDPGNLGTIIRTCDWFGVQKIVCSKDTADCFNEKVVQATMGSIFRVDVEYTDLSRFLKQFEGPIYGALMEGNSIFKSDVAPKGALILGNEGNGIRPEIAQMITNPVHIPGAGKAESLNVAVAGAILLGEICGKTL